MRVTLMSHTGNPANVCGEAAATCTASSNHLRSLKQAMYSGHESVLEHAVFTFRVEDISRAALAQLTRHRLASFSVQSQRYVRIDGRDLVIPERILHSEFAQEAEQLVNDAMNLYQRMAHAGIPVEDARYVTPQAVTTTLIVTMNARELRHFFNLRCCNRAQWEIREMADQMLKHCKRVAPELFENAGPGCVSEYCGEKRSCGFPRKKSEWDDGLIK